MPEGTRSIRIEAELAGLDERAVLPIRVGGSIGPGRLEIPSEMDFFSLDDERVIAWSWRSVAEGRRTVVHPKPGAPLWRFLHLRSASDEAIAEFARDWGPLELCEAHGFPAMHICSEYGESYHELDEQLEALSPEFSQRDRIPCRPRTRDGWHLEPISQWRRWAGQLTNVLKLACVLAGERDRRPDLWRIAAPNGMAGFTSVEIAQSPWDHQRALFSSVMTTHLEMGRGLTGLAWDHRARQYRVFIECGGLFAAIVGQMLAVVVSEVGLAMCSRCGLPYLRESMRRPRSDKGSYCLECRPIVEREWKKESARKRRARTNEGE
jgi:hypothetical protein